MINLTSLKSSLSRFFNHHLPSSLHSHPRSHLLNNNTPRHGPLPPPPLHLRRPPQPPSRLFPLLSSDQLFAIAKEIEAEIAQQERDDHDDDEKEKEAKEKGDEKDADDDGGEERLKCGCIVHK